MTPFVQQRLAEFSTDPEADIIADDCTSRGCGDDEADASVWRVPAYTAALTRIVSPGAGMPALSIITIRKIAPYP
jgi:hypothetical protein